MISFVILQNKVEETASAEVGAGGGGMDVDQEDVEMPDAPPVLVHQVKEKKKYVFNGTVLRFYMKGGGEAEGSTGLGFVSLVFRWRSRILSPSKRRNRRRRRRMKKK